MSSANEIAYGALVVPTNVVSTVDISRLVKEAEYIDSEMTASAARAKTGGEQSTVPTMSDQLHDFLEKNSLSLTDSRQRTQVITLLRQLKDHAPVIHMTFATIADRDSLETLTAWVRESVHPQAVIVTGLQPDLVGGVYLRTPNHVHDLSLRGKLDEGHAVLLNELSELRHTGVAHV